jgi:predicted small integral membrane protein
MDTTFPENALLYRRITSPVLWNLAYWLIILGEGLTSLSLALAAIGLIRLTALSSIAPSASCLSAPRSVSWCGSSVLWSLLANGLQCGNRGRGTAKRRRFGFT